jgi:hypothetical protein
MRFFKAMSVLFPRLPPSDEERERQMVQRRADLVVLSLAHRGD